MNMTPGKSVIAVRLRWDPSVGYWNCGKGTTTIISDTWMHPQVGTNADLTWIAPVAKPTRIKISGAVKYPGKSGDGATVTIFHIHKAVTQKLWTRDLARGQAVHFDLTAAVQHGDAIIFQVGAKQNNQDDRVEIDPLIESLDDRTSVRVEMKPDTAGISDDDSWRMFSRISNVIVLRKAISRQPGRWGPPVQQLYHPSPRQRSGVDYLGSGGRPAGRESGVAILVDMDVCRGGRKLLRSVVHFQGR